MRLLVARASKVAFAVGSSLFFAAVISTAHASAESTLGGTVRSARTGEPLKSVQVSLSPISESESVSKRTATGPEGEFLFTRLAAANYRLQFRKTGYKKIPARPTIVSLSVDEKVTDLDTRMVPAAAISGRVVDSEREPVPDARVAAYALSHREDQVILSFVAHAQSDDLGEYRLYNLAAGKYIVSASPPRLGTPAGDFYAGIGDAYYPQALDPSQSMMLKLRWGDELEDIDPVLSDEPVFRLSGVMLDEATGGGCFDCVMRIARLDGKWIQVLSKRTLVSSEGVFLVRGLNAGSYRLSVRQAGDRLAVGQSVVQITDRDLDDVVVVAGRGRGVAGKIAFEEDAPEEPGEELNISLRALSAADWPRPQARIKEDFSFFLEAVPATAYRLEVGGLPPGGYLKTVRLGGQPLPAPEVTVRGDAPVSGVQALIAFDGATVSGQVKPRRSGGSEEDLIEARVGLIPKGNQGGYVEARRVETTPDGRFIFRSVVPGTYTLYAVPSVRAIQLMDPAVQGALRSFGRTVALDPEESSTVDLPLAPDPDGAF